MEFAKEVRVDAVAALPQTTRRPARAHARLIALSCTSEYNPDMLHMGILPTTLGCGVTSSPARCEACGSGGLDRRPLGGLAQATALDLCSQCQNSVAGLLQRGLRAGG